MRMASLSENVEMYLKTVYLLSKDSGAPAKTTDISKDLKVSPSSVTEMLEKLQKDGYVTHRKYRGAHLTSKGKDVAEKIMRKHCLIERFLVQVLDVEDGKFHDQACKMEHVLNDATAIRLRKLVNLPPACPSCYDRRTHHCRALFS